MHRVKYALVIILISSSCLAQADKKNVEAFYEQLQGLQVASEGKAPFAKKVEAIKKIEDDFKRTLKSMKKQSPSKALKEEKEISLLFENLRSVFELASSQAPPGQEACSQVQVGIEAGDSMGRPEGAGRSRPAKEAIKLLKFICE